MAQFRDPISGVEAPLSATVVSACDILQRCLPVLLDERVDFKVCSTLGHLRNLNGAAGSALSQIGKFITIYPRDDIQAVALADPLHDATKGFRGPVIPSDRPLHPGSLVHYRYGGFTDRKLQTPLGNTVQAILGPDGQLLADERSISVQRPAWVVDPFVEAGVATEFDKPPQIIRGRYLIVSTIQDSPRGSVYLGVDIAELRSCVIKLARRDALADLDGRDARDRLRHEAAILVRLEPANGSRQCPSQLMGRIVTWSCRTSSARRRGNMY